MNKQNVVLKKMTSIHYAVMPAEAADGPVNASTMIGVIVDGSVIERTDPIAWGETDADFAKMIRVKFKPKKGAKKLPVAIKGRTTDALSSMVDYLNKTFNIVNMDDIK